MVTIPSWDEAETIVAAHTRAREDNMLGEEETRPTEEEDADENSLSSLKERLKRAIYFLSEEAWGGEESLNYSLEHELEVFGEESENLLNSMSPTDARQWLAENIEALEVLRATEPEERHCTLRKLVALRGGLSYTAEHLAGEWGPAPKATTEEQGADDDEIPWDDGDDGDEEEGFHQAATREIVQAYRMTAMCLREELLARLRKAAALLGWHAAEVVPDPYRHTLNSEIGRFVARAEFCLRGICPIDAQAWLESNIGEFEALRARSAREYDQAALVLAGLNDRLFGLLYEIAREK